MGKVTQDHWDWCLICNELIKRIDENFKRAFTKTTKEMLRIGQMNIKT